jgi:Collagen triple helix repeat (20 copies)
MKKTLVFLTLMFITTGAYANCGNGGSNGEGCESGGTVGPTGPQGPAGINGTDGTNGANGHNGSNGSNGTSGTNGQTGAQGPTGTAGANGTNGINGVDATAQARLLGELDIRIIDTQHFSLYAFDSYHFNDQPGQDVVLDGRNAFYGAKFVVKLGKSYEEREIDKLKELLYGHNHH